MEPLDRLLTVEDLAEYLDVPVATVYAWRYRDVGPRGFVSGGICGFDGAMSNAGSRTVSPRHVAAE